MQLLYAFIISMTTIKLNDDILLSVRKPARYIGKEHNAIEKDWDKISTRVCLCFPDVYEIGMSNLGIKILYHILNSCEDALCERAFTPWLDMEELMRNKKIPLFSLESKRPVSDFDIIGFSISYELSYTNILTMLDLAGIPLRSKDRQNKNFPLIIAGGTCSFNPEPLAEFIDLFLIGEGEEAVTEIIDTYKRYKGKKELLSELAKIEGAYVPSLGSQVPVKKRVVKELSNEYFPTVPIVPYIPAVHDRITLEIMRGCPHNCRFCQARSIYSPVRIRRPGDIRSLAKDSYDKTGLDEISLLSLSTSDYPGLENLLAELSGDFCSLGVGISLPSLRVEDKIKQLPSLISFIKKSGLTFAPEAGTERLLEVIGKNIDHKKLFDAIRQAYRLGWRRLKLYFMIGLPSEEKADLEGIVEISEKAAMLRKEFSRHPAEIIISVSSFVPKPHTEFERLPMAGPDELKQKQAFLKERIGRRRYLKLKLHDIKTSVLEATFSRGDRALSNVLVSAWKNGARFDAWTESFKPEVWDKAFLDNNISKKDYLKAIPPGQILPWPAITL